MDDQIVIILNVAVLLFISHISFGLPAFFYLCTVLYHRIRSSRRSKLEAFDVSVLNRWAYLSSIDGNLHMNNQVYFSEFERGAWDWLWRVGNGFPAFNRKYRQNVVLTGLTTRFRREIGLFRQFQVLTKLIHFDEKHLYLEQRIVRNGFVHCSAFADWSVVDQRTGKRTTTEDFIRFIGLSDESKMQMITKCPQSLLHWLHHLKDSSSELRAESGLTPSAIEGDSSGSGEEKKIWRRDTTTTRLSSRWSIKQKEPNGMKDDDEFDEEHNALNEILDADLQSESSKNENIALIDVAIDQDEPLRRSQRLRNKSNFTIFGNPNSVCQTNLQRAARKRHYNKDFESLLESRNCYLCSKCVVVLRPHLK